MSFAGSVLEDADFSGHVFRGKADFAGCRFRGDADFSQAVFEGRVHFPEASFDGDADFLGAAFGLFANFRDVTVAGDLRFTAATFADGPLLEGVEINGSLRLNRAVLTNATLLGPFQAERITLHSTVFERRTRIEARVREVHCERARFPGGVQLLMSGPDIRLQDCELGAASLIAPHWQGGARPRLVTLSGTDVSTLTIGEADLSACKLANAHNLDKIKIETDRVFGWTPSSVRVSRRQITGDERRWRHVHGPRRGRELWRPPQDWPERLPPATASEVIKTYRQLRRSREEAKDEPGAANFYYGEMEMRRIGTWYLAREQRRQRRWRGWLIAHGDHALLWLYWIVSGYGLRAWRAFTALGLLVAVAAAALLAWGFPAGAHLDYADSVRYTLRAATSFLRGPEQKLTPTGEWIELILRFSGPVLFGLAILALRGRVKR